MIRWIKRAGKRGFGGLIGRITIAVVILAPSLLMVGVSPANAYADEGDITGSNPASRSDGGATENEFIETCVHPPQLQGADAWVFDIDSQTGQATANGSSAGPYDLDLAFYSVDCAFIGQSTTAVQDETAAVPSGTRYVVVNAFLGAAIHVCLVVGSDSCSQTPTPTPTSSETPTPTPIETPTPTPTPSDVPTPPPTSTPIATRSPTPTPLPPGPRGVSSTITARPRIASYRKPFVITGVVTAEESCKRPYLVTMRRQVSGRGSELVDDTIPVSKTNEWQIRASSKYSATYAVTARAAGGCASFATLPYKVPVRVRISITPPDMCGDDVAGRVQPNHKGQILKLQQRVDSRWAKRSQARLSKGSRFSLPLDECSGRFRVVYRPQDRRNVGGFRTFLL